MPQLEKFGFTFDKGGAHIARTMMYDELAEVLSVVDFDSPSRADFANAIEDHNCLGKRSGKARQLTTRHLVSLYGLDSSVTLFRLLLYFWRRDPDGRPLLALLIAYSRDAVLRLSAPLVLNSAEGAVIPRETTEAYIDKDDPGRFSSATLKSVAQNVNGTWTKSGHLTGHVKKVRTKAKATPGAVALALTLGYLVGARGEGLLVTEYMKLLDCSKDRAIELAEEASRRGWIVFKRIGDVMEVQFPALLTAQDMEWLRE